jgi:general secretion pathway protein D
MRPDLRQSATKRLWLRAVRSSRSGGVVALAALFAACSLPSEQLGLPSAISPSQMSTGAVPGGRSGVALGDPSGAGTNANRLYQGSGKFTGQAAQQPGKASTTIRGDGISLDLAGASIPDAAKAVLGDVLNVTYVVSDKVKGFVTLKTSRPVSRDGLLEIFESVLAAEGAALVVDGPVFKILPRDEAIAEGRPLKTDGDQTARPPGLATEIVPLKFVSASEMERILKSVAPQSTISRVDTARNLLVLTGTRTELASLAETVSVFDVDWMRGMSFGIFPLETSDTEAIAQELDRIFANDHDSPTKGVVRFIPNARLKSILVITSRPEYLKKAETWIKRIDLASEATEKRAFVYHVQYRPAQELAQLLHKVYASSSGQRPGDGISQSTPQTSATGSTAVPQPADQAFTADQTRPAGPTSSAAAASGSPQPLPSPGVSKLALTPAATAVSASDATGDPSAALAQTAFPSGSLARPVPDDRASGISIIADEANNSLVISATPSEIRRVRQILQQIDTQQAQILLEATIAEVTLNDDLKFGLRWFLEKGPSSFNLSDSVLSAIAPAIPALSGFTYFFNTANARVVLNALSGVTNVNVVSSPSLMTLNNKKAVLQIGDEVPIATQSAVSVVTPGAPIVNSISFRNTGVILSITPRISDNGQVQLEIEQEVSDVKATTSSKIDSPTISQRRIKTTVSVANGGTIVLAGMMKDSATRSREQVPLVGDVPLVGNLFKNKDDKIARTELLIAITPQIVKDANQTNLIAAEFRDRLNFATRPQRQTGPDHREQLDRLQR